MSSVPAAEATAWWICPLPATREPTHAVEAQAGGKVLLPQLVEVNGNHTGRRWFISTAQIEPAGRIWVVNGVRCCPFRAWEAIKSRGGEESLTWMASGAGSVLDLSALTNLTGGNCVRWDSSLGGRAGGIEQSGDTGGRKCLGLRRRKQQRGGFVRAARLPGNQPYVFGGSTGRAGKAVLLQQLTGG